MRKRYRKRTTMVEAEQFRPDLYDVLPEDVKASLTPGKFWLRNVQHGRMTRSYVEGVPIQPFDFIVVTGKEKVIMSQEDFNEIYEAA